MKPPVFDIEPAAFAADPYPFYQRMRAEAPVCFVPQLGATLLTRRDDIFECEKNIEVFSSRQPGGLMTVLMGENMMRKDGEPHMRERQQTFKALSPKTVANHWRQRFLDDARAIVAELPRDRPVDLVADYAMRLSGEALKHVTGLTQVTWRDIDRFSQAMIDGIANYAGDPQIEAECRAATAGIDAAITQRLEAPGNGQDFSMLAVMLANGMPLDNVRHNIKLAISGGQNEPRDAIAGCVWAMLAHPGQMALLREGRADWNRVFDEYCRFIAPIGMSPRRIAKPFSFKGVDFEPESRAFLMFASANRDEDCFSDPGRFNLEQDTAKAIAFGAGPHFCAGAWVSRSLVAEVALPVLFDAFPDMQLADAGEPVFQGWAFRGLKRLDVVLEP